MNFYIFRLPTSMIMVHIIEQGQADRIRAFDDIDEAYRYVLNHEGLVSFWEQYLAELN